MSVMRVRMRVSRSVYVKISSVILAYSKVCMPKRKVNRIIQIIMRRFVLVFVCKRVWSSEAAHVCYPMHIRAHVHAFVTS
jgi:hypothetical protein